MFPNFTLAGTLQPLSDPVGSSPIVTAIQWLQATLIGTIATTVAVIVIATSGLMMLTGRIDFRRGATTIAGCFMLFGASSIAAGIRFAADAGYGSGTPLQPAPVAVAPSPLGNLPKPPPRPSNYDPYAGASIPRR